MKLMLVEDDPTDARMVIRAARRAGIVNEIIHCSSGDNALRLLREKPGTDEAPIG